MTRLPVAILSWAFVFSLASAATAQEEQPQRPRPAPAAAQPSAAAASPVPPLKLQVVLSRFEGERKVASLPYVLLMDGNGNGTLNMGVRVAVPSVAPSSDEPLVGPVTYENIGTIITCRAEPRDRDRFHLDLTVSESSVLPDQAIGRATGASTATSVPVRAGVPMFPTFRLTGALMLSSGETAELGTATNPVTGQVTKVDVTLTVLK